MADLGSLNFGVHLIDYTDAEADKIKKKLENLSVKLTIDGKNVNISHTDLIKKQIEDAIKSVSVQSVKVDTNAIKAQVSSAFQGFNPQISVTLLKGALSNDLQNYLNSKTFNVGISISKGNAQNAVNTAFANLSVPVSVTVKASAVAQQLQQSLANAKAKVGVEAKDVNAFISDIEKRLKGRKIKIDVEPNQRHLVQAVKQALQGVSVKAQVTVDVDAQKITNAVQAAINNAKFTYTPTGGGGGSKHKQHGGGSGSWSKQATNGLYESARASVSLGKSLSTNIRIAGELGSTLGNIASVFRIREIAMNLVQIGGQLENQRLALGAILQDGGKATEMFGKIQTLAVKSPFGIMDLNQYTKQLSAYGIEYNELYDTMKRMADISAGVGVDMGRIILAFGQVKAAGFLKGTELRQFTEANIPMVQALADKFSILEKRIVSASEVYDMISKKKVTFQDVKDVLWNLTGEGGMFNNMQEALSESLASKWKNLSDAIDVMYGKMADSGMGDWLKELAELLTELTGKWQTFASAAVGAMLSYGTYKASISGSPKNTGLKMYDSFLDDKSKQANALQLKSIFQSLTKTEQELVDTTHKLTKADIDSLRVRGELLKKDAIRLIQTKQLDTETARYVAQVYKLSMADIQAANSTTILGRALTGLGNTIKGIGAAMGAFLANPWTWITIGFSAVTELWSKYNRIQDEIEERTKNTLEAAKGSISAIDKELGQIEILDINKLNTDEVKTKINDVTTLIKNEAPNWRAMLDDVFKKKADGSFVHSAKEQLDMLIAKAKEVKKAKDMMFDAPSVLGQGIANTGSILFNEDLVENMKDYQKDFVESEKTLGELSNKYKVIVSAIDKTVGKNKELREELSKTSTIQEQIKVLSKYTYEFNKFRNILGKSDYGASRIVSSWYGQIKDMSKANGGSLTEMLKDLYAFADDAVWGQLLSRGYTKDSQLDDSAQQVVYYYGNKLIEFAGLYHPKVQEDFWKSFLPKFNMKYKKDSDFSVVPEGSFDTEKTEYDPSKDEVAKMWKKRSEEIDKAVKMYDQWKKLEGADKSRARVQSKDELANLFSGAYGFKLDLENPTAAYEFIQSKLNKNLSAQKELLIQLGVKISDAELKDAQDKLKQFVERTKNELKRTTEQWGLYKQLFEATGNKEFAMTAFKVTPVWDEAARTMKASLDKTLKDAGFGFESVFDISDEDAKILYRDLYDSWKEIKDRIEKNGIDLKVNIADIYKSSKDFDIRIDTINRELHDKLQKLSTSGLSQDVIGVLTQDLTEQAEHAISEVEFEKFKKSVDYVRFFSNLENQGVNSILAMRDAMLKFGNSTELSTEEMDALVEDVKRLEKALVDKHPFKAIELSVGNIKALRDAYNSASNAYKKDPTTDNLRKKEQAKSELDAEIQNISSAFKRVYDRFSEFANAVGEISSMLEKFGNRSLTNFANFLDSASSGMQSGYNVGSLFGAQGGIIGGFVGAATGAMAGLVEAGRKAVEAEQERSQIVIDRLDKVASLLKDSIAESLTGLYNSTLDATSKMELERKKAEYDEAEKKVQKQNGSINPNSWYAMTFDNTTFSWDTNSYLVYSKKTHDAINEALRMDNEFMAAYASMLAQRDELMYQQATYTDKDSDKVDAYKRDKQLEIEELNAEIEKLTKDMLSSLYNVDFKDWASQLTDSIVNAWANGEDAAKAYEATVSDILRNVATSMIQQKILGDYFAENIDPWIKDFIASGGVMTDELYYRLAEIVDGGMERIDQAEDALDAWEEVLNEKGMSLKDNKDDSSSGGLSKGIQSVTEDTANLLASYLNAIRQDTSVKRTLIEQLVSVDVPQMSIIAQAQLQQLQQVAANTKRNADAADSIREALGSVIGIGKNGKAIKIV